MKSLPSKFKTHSGHIKKIVKTILEVGGKKIVMVILFGSFARGTRVFEQYSEGNAVYTYASDYDLLVITKEKIYNKTNRCEGKIIKEVDKRFCTKHGHNPYLVIESIEYVNSELEKGCHFFSEIKKEGIILFDCKKFNLSEAKVLTEEEAKQMAKEDYDHWFNSSDGFLRYADLAIEEGDFKGSVFHLHQAAEHFYNCALLVLIGYKPKTHDLIQLGKLSYAQSNQFLPIFPISVREPKLKNRNFSKYYIQQLYDSNQKEDWFKLLQIAYIDSRYNKYYKIKKEQLEYLIERVKLLKEVVKAVCKERI